MILRRLESKPALRARRIVVAACTFSALCGITEASAQAQTGSAEAAGVEAAAVPVLDWTACASDTPTWEEEPIEASPFQCATATVPLDYTAPKGRTIKLALIRLRASDPLRRIGSLFVNPGGPGESGVEFVRQTAFTRYSAEVRAHFDLVGFDPRFTGESQKAQCTTTSENFDLFGGDFTRVPVTPAQERAVTDSYAKYTKLCADRMPDMQYASTANAARDLELLRRAVGDASLSYAGYSYGTVLGQTYAALYPQHVRAMLLDGVADAEAWSGTPATKSVPYWVRTGAAVGASEALKEFFRICAEVGAERCPIAKHGDPATVFAQLANALRPGPLPNTSESYDYSWLTNGALQTLYSPELWDLYAAEVSIMWQRAFVTPGSPAESELERADADWRARIQAEPWNGLREKSTVDEPTPELQDQRGAKIAVSCADTLNPTSLQDWARIAAEEETRAVLRNQLDVRCRAVCTVAAASARPLHRPLSLADLEAGVGRKPALRPGDAAGGGAGGGE